MHIALDRDERDLELISAILDQRATEFQRRPVSRERRVVSRDSTFKFHPNGDDRRSIFCAFLLLYVFSTRQTRNAAPIPTPPKTRPRRDFRSHFPTPPCRCCRLPRIFFVVAALKTSLEIGGHRSALPIHARPGRTPGAHHARETQETIYTTHFRLVSRTCLRSR